MATCEEKLSKQFGETFSRDEVDKIVEELRNERRKLDDDEKLNQLSVIDSVTDSNSNNLEQLELMKIRDAQKQIDELDKLKYFGTRKNRLNEFIKSVAKGTAIAVRGARNSAQSRVNSLKTTYLGYLTGGLNKISNDALVKFRKGANDLENLKAIWGIKTGNQINDSIGTLVNDIFEKYRNAYKREGVIIKFLPNRGFFTSHNKEKLLQTSDSVFQRLKINTSLKKKVDGDIEKFKLARDRWKNFITPLLDRKTFTNIFGDNITDEEIDEFLNKSFDSLTDQGKLISEKTDIPSRLSRGRVLLFKDPASQLAYSAKYGKGNLSDSIDAEFRSLATNLGLLQKLGTNPSESIDTIFNKAVSLDKRITTARIGESIQPSNLKDILNTTKRLLKEIDGTIYDNPGVPGHVVRAMKSYILIKFLPATTPTGFLLDSANLAEQLGRYGGSFPINLAKAMGWLTKNTFVQGEEFKKLADLVGVYKDSHIGAFARYTGTDTESDIKILHRLEHISLTISGHARMDYAKRVANSAAFARAMAQNADVKFDNIQQDLREVLNRHAVTPELWNVWRKHKVTAGNKDYITTLGMDDITEDEVKNYLAKSFGNKSPSAAQIERGRTEIQNRLGDLFQDTNDFAVLRPDASKVFWTLGADPATLQGRSLRALGQLMSSFRSYQFSFLTKTMMRFIYDKNAESIGDALLNWKWNWKGFAQYSMGVMMLAATEVAAKHIIEGRKITGGADFYRQTLEHTDILPFLSILFPQKRTIGNTVDDIFGPAANAGLQTFVGLENLLSGNLSTKNAWHALYNNIPFINSIYLKRFFDYNLFNWFINNLTGKNPGLGQPGGYNSYI